MPDLQLWSATAADNATADPDINWAEGQPPSSVNNSARSMMAAIATWRDLIQFGLDSWGGTAGGTVDALTVALEIDPPDYAAGMTVLFKAAGANTGAATINVNALGAKALQRDGSALTAGLLVTGRLVAAVYDGTAFQIIASPDLSAYATLTGTETLTGKTIDGDDNTVQDLALSSLKTVAGEASKGLRRDGSGAVVADVTLPSGDIVGTADTQTLSNKTFSSDVTITRSGSIPSCTVERTDNPNPAKPFYAALGTFIAPDNAGNVDTYARLLGAVSDDTSGSEDGHLYIQLMRAGVLTNAVSVTDTAMTLVSGLASIGFGVDNVTSVVTASGASIDISGLATGYTYWLECQSLKPAADAPLYLQVHDGSGFVTGAGSYAYASGYGTSGSSAFSSSSSTSATFIDLCGGLNVEATSGTGWSGRIFLHNAAEAGEFTMVQGDGNFLNSSAETAQSRFVGRRLTAQANARFQLIFNGSTFSSGKVHLKRMRLS